MIGEMKKGKKAMTLLDKYFETTEVKARKEILLNMLAEENTTPEAEICKELFQLRYKKVGSGRNASYQDRFMGLWMNMLYHKRSVSSEKKLIKARAELLKELDQIGIPAFAATDAQHRLLYYKEAENLVTLYRDCCLDDHGYQRTLLGLKKMKMDNVEKKIRVDIFKTGIEVPECTGLLTELDAFVQAARAVDEKYYGNQPVEEDDL